MSAKSEEATQSQASRTSTTQMVTAGTDTSLGATQLSGRGSRSEQLQPTQVGSESTLRNLPSARQQSDPSTCQTQTVVTENASFITGTSSSEGRWKTESSGTTETPSSAPSTPISTTSASLSSRSTASTQFTELPLFSQPTTKTEEKIRSAVFVRTAERVDRIFPQWIRECFTSTGLYIANDINLPLRLPVRRKGHTGFRGDSPITEIGHITSQMVGRALRLRHLLPDLIISSPALRCVQTAQNIRRLMLDEVTPIHVEPGLLDWTKWYNPFPDFMTVEELSRVGYAVSKNYAPVVSMETLKGIDNESIQEVYKRIQSTIHQIINQRFPKESLLFVGHAVTIDAAGRKLMKKETQKLPNEADMKRLGLFYPYSSSVVFNFQPNTDKWELKPDAIPHISYMDFSSQVDTRFLIR